MLSAWPGEAGNLLFGMLVADLEFLLAGCGTAGGLGWRAALCCPRGELIADAKEAAAWFRRRRCRWPFLGVGMMWCASWNTEKEVGRWVVVGAAVAGLMGTGWRGADGVVSRS